MGRVVSWIAPPVFVSGNLVVDESVGFALHDFQDAGVFLVEDEDFGVLILSEA